MADGSHYDLLNNPISETDRSNPFTPDFGVSPLILTGRSEQQGELRTGLGLGPRNPAFTSILIGHRGTGKTVLIDHAEGLAAAAGWTVLRTDATTPGIYDRLEEALADNLAIDTDDDPSAGKARSETRWSIGVSIASVSRTTLPAPPDNWSFKRKIQALGESAAERRSAVLISVDELQSGVRDELRRLSADLQQVTKRRPQLPVAFIGAGLPIIEYTIMRDPKMTFFHRCHDIDVQPLDFSESLEFFNKSIRHGGGECDNDALSLMANASRGLPYKMQLIGDNAWRISGSPADPIDVESATLAITATEQRMTARIYSHTWDRLADIDQTVLKEIAIAGGATDRRTLGRSVSVASSTLSNRLKRLEHLGCIDREGPQAITLGVMTPSNFVNEIIADEMAVEPDVNEIARTAVRRGTSQATAKRCNKLLKTVNATCILKSGHRGNCRSR